MRKYPGGRTHVDLVTLTIGRLLAEPFGGGRETIPVSKSRTKIVATATPTVTSFQECDIEHLAFENYPDSNFVRVGHVSAPKIGLPIALGLVLI